MERLVGNPFPQVATPYREHQVQPQTPLLGSSTKSYEPIGSKKQKPVEVKDEKLGVFFAAIAQSLNNTVSSINQKQASIETDIQSSKQYLDHKTTNITDFLENVNKGKKRLIMIQNYFLTQLKIKNSYQQNQI